MAATVLQQLRRLRHRVGPESSMAGSTQRGARAAMEVQVHWQFEMELSLKMACQREAARGVSVESVRTKMAYQMAHHTLRFGKL